MSETESASAGRAVSRLEATGITAFLEAGGELAVAQQLAGHSCWLALNTTELPSGEIATPRVEVLSKAVSGG